VTDADAYAIAGNSLVSQTNQNVAGVAKIIVSRITTAVIQAKPGTGLDMLNGHRIVNVRGIFAVSRDCGRAVAVYQSQIRGE
jgi:hypothetical protein